jgi:5'-nucleotidase
VATDPRTDDQSKEKPVEVFRTLMGRRQMLAVLAAALVALGVVAVPQAAPGELCFSQPGVTACVAPEFKDFWQKNGGLKIFGYPLEPAKQEGGRLVQYYERQRLELHPESAAPYTVQLGRVNDEALQREGRDWHTFPVESQAGAGCVVFGESGHTVCGEFLRQWRAQGLELGDPGVSARESLALWGLPISQPQEEINVDGFKVLTQHFERARMERYTPAKGVATVALTRLGVELLPMNLRILAVNDLHGQLSTGRRVAGRLAGGAAYLAAYLKQYRAEAPGALLVHAGDMVGASEPTSALFKDMPTMEFMNRLGFDVGTSGNHEFDRGYAEYKRKVQGGSDPQTGPWKGANFSYLTANVIDKATGKTIFPAYKIVDTNGARIGFIGVVLKNTPEIVTPSGVAGLEFLDEVESINKATKELQAQGVHAIVVLIHQGGTQNQQTNQVSGPIVDIANRTDADVDIICSGHTHQFTNAVIAGKLVTQAFSYSTAFASIDTTIDRAKRDFVAKKAEIITTFNDSIQPDAETAAFVKGFQDKVAPLVSRVVGTASAEITAVQNEAGESALGNLIADAQRSVNNTQMAFMNPGGIRAPLDAGPATYGELFSIQPFANDLVAMKLTGEQIYKLLNQQWQPQADGTLTTRFLQISGLSYTWSDSRAVGDKVVEVRGPDGQPLDRAKVYTVTVNSFLSTGGDGFAVLAGGADKVTGPVDLDALVQYVEKLPQPFGAKIEGRIVKQ